MTVALALSLLACGGGAGASSENLTGVLIWKPPAGAKLGRVQALAVAPTNPRIVYAGTRLGLYQSTDGGRRWTKLFSGEANAVVVHPRQPATIYLATEDSDKSVFKSTDGGRTWLAMSTGLKDAWIAKLAIDPFRPERLYGGAGVSSGLFRSLNAGRRWRHSGLDGSFVEAVALDPRMPGVVYAAAWGPDIDPQDSNRVMRSANGGGSWVKLSSGLTTGYEYVVSLAVSPRPANVIFAGTGSGVFRSADGGRHWRAIGLASARGDVRSIVVEPREATSVYAATDGSGVFRSQDSGRSWSSLSQGLTNLKVGALALAGDGSMLYAATNAGVFSLRLRR